MVIPWKYITCPLQDGHSGLNFRDSSNVSFEKYLPGKNILLKFNLSPASVWGDR